MNPPRSGSLGQLLIIKLEESRWTASLERTLDRYRPAGVYLSCLRSPESTAELLARIARTLDTNPLLWLEEEGGSVDPLRAFLPALPSPRSAAVRGPAAVEGLGELAAAGLRLLGFNTNCAPLLDLSTCNSEESLRARTFGSDPHEVVRSASAFLCSLGRRKILACGKFFPGASTTGASPTLKLPIVGKPMAELWDEDVVPYRRLLARLPLVMISNAAYKAYDFAVPRPACESPSILTGLLRLKLRYAGVSVADLARTGAALDPVELGHRVAQSIVAGCDLVVVPGHEQFVKATLAGLASAAGSATITEQLEQSLKRLGAIRKGLAPPSGRLSKRALDRLARQFESFARETNLKSNGQPHKQTQEPMSA